MIRPGQKIVVVPGPEWGVRVIQPAAAAADWWDPNNEGLPVVAAYRAINSAGTPWPGGPNVYADTLVNQANPGVNDLIEGNGAVPWAAATGWGFVAAALQYFDTGIVPGATHAVLFNFAADAGLGYTGAFTVGGRFYFEPVGVRYGYGNGWRLALPPLVAGNLGIDSGFGYRNGVVDTPLIGAWTAPSLSFYIGSLNRLLGPLPGDFVTANTYAVAIYDNSIALSIPAVVAAMAAL